MEKKVLLFAAIFVGVMGTSVFAADSMEAAVQDAAVAVADEVQAAVEVGNKICPVGGEAIEAGKSVQVEVDGKIYNLCCAMCEKDFKADPAKYISKLQEAGEGVVEKVMDAMPEHK